MPYDPKAIANYFLRRGRREGVPIDPMKLQKLVYFAHGWHLAVRGERLINEPIEAWQYGPVVPRIYHAFKHYGPRPIRELAREFDGSDILTPDVPASDQSARSVLDQVWEAYRDFTGVQLSNMTHEADSPWYRARDGRDSPRGIDIEDEEIRRYFLRLGSSPAVA